MTTTTLPTARLRLADEGLGPIVEKFLAETGRTISTKCALRYAIRGLRGIKLETLKVAGKRLTSGDDSKVITMGDHFYLGGPLNVRGFEMRGLGPSSEGNAVGGLMYWAAGLHLYTPLPFR